MQAKAARSQGWMGGGYLPYTGPKYMNSEYMYKIGPRLRLGLRPSTKPMEP